jgi:HprK-related kinase A
MKLRDLPLSDLREALGGLGLALDFGFARARIRSDVPGLAEVLQLVYGAYPYEEPQGFFDVTVSVLRAGGVRRHLRRQIVFVLDGEIPFEPFAAGTHLPLMEWGLNWCFAARCNQHLLLHAGVVEHKGRAVLLPALPESGKSTLTAALSATGYRLLSDEFGAVRLADGSILPLVRPIALKNASIQVIRRFAPTATMGPVFPKTRKGDVAHMTPSDRDVASRHVPAVPAYIVFPKFEPGAEARLEALPPSRAFVKLSANSFNYAILGPDAFDAVGALVQRCLSFRLTFGDLDAAVEAIGQLLDQPASELAPTPAEFPALELGNV